MRVLVTGASSLIGAGVVRSLVERGDEVRVLQRRSAEPGSDVVEVLGDVADRGVVDEAIDGCDAVVHLAARVGLTGTREQFVETNVTGTRNLLEAAHERGVGRFVHVSSPSVAHDGHAIVGGGADEPTAAAGSAFYPETKAMAERLAIAADDARLGVVVVRPHLVWGPGDTQLVGRVVDRARGGRLALVGGGTALVDTTYVDNAVDALVAALDAVAPGAPCAGRAYVVSNGEPRPVRELVAGICAAAGVEFSPRDVDLRAARVVGSVVERLWSRLRPESEPPLTRFLAEQLGTAHWFDQRSVRRDLGWTPTIGLDEGFARLAEWYSSSGADPAG